jgi:Icc-related predicted phosphoesterase
VKVLAISDLHGILPAIPEADLLLIAGDITPDVYSYPDIEWTPARQVAWMFTNFKPWLEDIPVKNTVAIAGNHDYIFEFRKDEFLDDMPVHYLENSSVTIDGVSIYGAPWTPKFGNWAFMKQEKYLLEQWDKIPLDTNVLITHGPPFGILDQSNFFGDGMAKHAGSGSLRQKLSYGSFGNLKLHVFGHIHEGRGVTTLDGVTFANVAQMDLSYNPIYGCMEFEID